MQPVIFSKTTIRGYAMQPYIRPAANSGILNALVHWIKEFIKDLTKVKKEESENPEMLGYLL